MSWGLDLFAFSFFFIFFFFFLFLAVSPLLTFSTLVYQEAGRIEPSLVGRKREKAGIQVYDSRLEEAKASIDRKGANRRRRIPSPHCCVSQLS